MHLHMTAIFAGNSLTTKFIDFFNQLDLFQSMSSSTRSTNTLDLLFTPKQFKYTSSINVIAPVAYSDHSAVLSNLLLLIIVLNLIVF